MAALMRAVQYDSYGGGVDGLKHVEVPVPTPGKGEVLLKLEATSLNPYDVNTQKGVLRPFLPRKFPFIPGCDVAGEVVKVGPGVENFKSGDKVIAALNTGTGGGLAEYAVSKNPEGAALKSPSGKKYDAVIHCARAIPWSVFEPNLSSPPRTAR